MSKIIISDDLIELDLGAGSKEEVIHTLSDRMLARDLVKENYAGNVLRREKEFPTGLPTSIPVALCHTEAEFVLESALAVATLKNPLEFSQMGSLEKKVQAEIVFLLALKDPKKQVPWLQKMMNVFKDKDTLQKIRYSENKQELASYLQRVFE